MDIVLGIIAIIIIIAFFQKIVQGVIGALIFGFIGSLFGPTGTKLCAVIGFIWGVSLNGETDNKKEETDKATNKKPEEPKKSNNKYKSDNSKIIRCPYCKKKIRIKVPIPKKVGKCPACSGSFSIQDDGRGNIKAEKEEPKHKTSQTSGYSSKEGCYKILGISPTATPDEVRTAYRKKIREYHPDRVAGLGEKLKQMADEESKQINKAYSELKAKGLAR